jgi:hypothetical protein
MMRCKSEEDEVMRQVLEGLPDEADRLYGRDGDDWVNSPAVAAIYLVAAYARASCARGRFDVRNRVSGARASRWRGRALRQAGEPIKSAARSLAA